MVSSFGLGRVKDLEYFVVAEESRVHGSRADLLLILRLEVKKPRISHKQHSEVRMQRSGYRFYRKGTYRPCASIPAPVRP
jgi:hypothetical protein